jgi:acyl-[acyl-carrier-protein]-phospholipid O-acyltransferase/long-chain-fatty-acid--[acyl-carrier-protein] ligase
MSDPTVSPSQPSWPRNRDFWGITATQFLGAFNDNVFKQLVLLLCIDIAQGDPSRDNQWLVQVLFAAPFILFSGFAGYLSDRYSKTRIVVLCKLAEIGIAVAGMAAFGVGSLSGPLVVIFLMGTHSAFFGPPKYGILPELFRERDLPNINGVILMTTFLAVILALPTAGYLKDIFESRLWLASIACIALAAAGTTTSFLIRKLAAAEPELRFEPASLFIHPTTWRAMRGSRELMVALIAYSAFWLAGGVVYPNVVNFIGKNQFGLSDRNTGLLASCTGIGIVIGCMVAGALSKHRFRAILVRLGIWGMVTTLVLLAVPGQGLVEHELPLSAAKQYASDAAISSSPDPHSTIRVQFHPVWLGIAGTGVVLVLLGVSAGLFSVPIQVYLQARAPEDQKGRIIGVMNLFNWLALGAAGPYYGLSAALLKPFQAPNLSFGAAALAVVPLLLLYRPRDEALK